MNEIHFLVYAVGSVVIVFCLMAICMLIYTAMHPEIFDPLTIHQLHLKAIIDDIENDRIRKGVEVELMNKMEK